MKRNLLYFLALGSVLILSGCVARTYDLTRDRVDQNLASGNRGYLMGKVSAEELCTPRKTERTVKVFEIEMGKSYKSKQVNVPPASQSQGVVSITESSTLETPLAETMTVSSSSQKYVVGKNDTLQKISQKFYGTTKKWTKIYDANQDVLKGPDKVYPGQTLNIPDAGEIKPAAETLIEPKENLK